MKTRVRTRVRLLSRVSTVAIVAAGAFAAAGQAQANCDTPFNVPSDGTTVTTNQPCVVVDAPVTGDVVIQNVTINPGPDAIAVDVIANISDRLINNGSILGGYVAEGGQQFGALTIYNGASIGNGLGNDGLVNNFSINSTTGNGVQIGLDADGISVGHIVGGISNNGQIFGGVSGIAALYGSLSGGLTNGEDATINGGVGVFVADTFGDWTGGINNFGQVSGLSAAILLGNTDSVEDGGQINFSGGITNNGNATIGSAGVAIWITNDVTTFDNGISNAGEIEGGTAALIIGAETFNGGVGNNFGGVITGVDGPAVWVTSDTFNGGIQNAGLIENGNDALGGPLAAAILIEGGQFNGGILNDASGQIIATAEGGLVDAIRVEGDWAGDFTNLGLVQATDEGFDFQGGSYVGNFTNAGQILGVDGGVVFRNTEMFVAGAGEGVPAEFVNTGLIESSIHGFILRADEVHANFTNTFADVEEPQTPTIAGNNATFGVGVGLAAATWEGNITNDGVIEGGYAGMHVGVDIESVIGTPPNEVVVLDEVTNSFNGVITNSSTGSITGGQYGLVVFARDFDGAINNAGLITTGASGDVGLLIAATCDLDCEVGTSFNGNVTNSGSIFGGNTGLVFDYDVITSNFTNASGGSIASGPFGTGVSIVAGTYTGNITNNGVIQGGGTDTGLHIVTTGVHTGNIVNTNLISAPDNALHIEIDTLLVDDDPASGLILNTGTIQAPGATAVRLEIGNGATFTNASGGLVLGDIVFGGKAAYDFVGELGGVEGRVLGEVDNLGANDDAITVQNGRQYFFFEGKSLAISNIAAFNVNDGGTAVLGARSVGDTAGSTEFNAAVDNVNVNSGGTLYLDQSATLNVAGDYAQDANGTLMFYLGAPGGEGFSDLTGTQVAAPGDYGQIVVEGVATLDGTIAAFLDPTFDSANPGLTAVQYNDVIIAQGGIEGDFDFTALISNNSLFELSSVIDDNTVDLTVLRAPLGEVATVANIVNTGDPFDANITERTNGIGGGCGVSGAGWCRNLYAAAEPGATQVMTDATPGEDPFGWLRAGTRRVGETGVWGRGVGSWGETDGEALIPGSEYSLGGVIAGVDRVFTQNLLAGAAVQWTTTDVEFGAASGDAEVDSLEVGAYASLGDPRLYLNANVSYIWHDFEVNRVVGLNRATGDYDGETVSAYVEAGKTFETGGGLRIQPLLALSYAHLETDAYSETGTGTLLNVLEAELDSLKGVVGARGAYPLILEPGRRLITEVRVAWAHEFMDDHSAHFSDVQGGAFNPQLVTGEEFSRDTLVLGAGLSLSLSEATTVFADYDAGLNSDITTHTVSAGFRARW